VRMDAMEVGRRSGRPWLALTILCAGVLMITLDTTIVNVALPSIREDLRLTPASLIWVVNAYLLTFGGALLLGGRLGDLYGCRRLFLIGLALFTSASFACGIASTQAALVAARAVQGFGSATVMAVTLSLIVNMFPDGMQRTRAVSVYAFICGAGGSIGLLAGGVLTSALGWRWIFLINLPIGIAICALCTYFVSDHQERIADRRIDVWGAVTLTSSLMLAMFGFVYGHEAGWASMSSVSVLMLACLLFILFLQIESRVPVPLVPLGLFALRNLVISNVARMLYAAGTAPWFFVTALYLQTVLGYTPMQVALAFLPANLIMVAFSLGLAANLVNRFGIRLLAAVGLLLGGSGLLLFAQLRPDGDAMTDVLPGMIMLGLGAGMTITPLLLASMSDVAPRDRGVASGVVSTSSLLGGALGLAILISLSAARTDKLLASGMTTADALTDGYRLAFLLGAACLITAALLGGAFLRTRAEPSSPSVTSPDAIAREHSDVVR
jgi:EmrB/QacA subfamily drug resistance transporter